MKAGVVRPTHRTSFSFTFVAALLLLQRAASTALRGNDQHRQLAASSSLSPEDELLGSELLGDLAGPDVDSAASLKVSWAGLDSEVRPRAVALHDPEDEKAVRQRADGVIDFLMATGESRRPSFDSYERACEGQLSQLLRTLDADYSDAQLETVLRNECMGQRQFPRTYETGFTSERACQDFAFNLVAARDDEIASGSTAGYTKFCKAFYEHKFGPAPNIGSPTCPCVGFAGVDGDTMVEIDGNQVQYPADMGGGCSAWDSSAHPSCQGGDRAAWCAQKWCYVDPCNCDVAVHASSYLKTSAYRGQPVFYSYETCDATPPDPASDAPGPDACGGKDDAEACEASGACAWTGGGCADKWSPTGLACQKPPLDSLPRELAMVAGSQSCACIGISNQSGSIDVHINGGIVEYPADTGALCKAWDYKMHPECQGSGSMPDWCVHAWCFVDPCYCDAPSLHRYGALPDATYMGMPLFRSYSTCGGEPLKTASEMRGLCLNQESRCDCKALDHCTWEVVGHERRCLDKAVVEKCFEKTGHAVADDDEPCEPVSIEAEESAEAPGEHPHVEVDRVAADLADLEAAGLAKGKRLDLPAQPLGTSPPQAGPAKANLTGIFGIAECPCVGFAGLDGENPITIDGKQVLYPADQGSMCRAWDDDMHPDCKAGAAPGPGNGFCGQQWCYVDPCFCDIPVQPKVSSYMPAAMYQGKTLYYSYATCQGGDTWTADNHKEETWTADNHKGACSNQEGEETCGALEKCAWTGERCLGKELQGACTQHASDLVVGSPGCRCVGIDGLPGAVRVPVGGETVRYPADVGSTCNTWDFNVHPECKKGEHERPDWCGAAWCFVDPCECDQLRPPKETVLFPNVTYQGLSLYFSYETCSQKDVFTEEVKSACVNQDNRDSCAALSRCAWDGQQCLGKELVEICEKVYERHFAVAPEPEEEPEDGPLALGLEDCPCIGFNEIDGVTNMVVHGESVPYPGETGGQCKAWDANRHALCKDGDAHDWCGKRWCYVDPCRCNLAELPKTSAYLGNATYRGRELYYSYATCQEEDTFTEKFNEGACVNQLDYHACVKQERCAWDGTKCGGKAILDKCHEAGKESVVGQKSCRCVGIANTTGSMEVSVGPSKLSYPSDTGASCRAWDEGSHPDCKGEAKPDWCAQEWCFVDPCDCALDDAPKLSKYVAGAKWGATPVYFSYATCGGVDSYTAEKNVDACVNKGTQDACLAAEQCAWAGDRCLGKELTMCT